MSIETPTTVTTVLAWLNNAWKRTKTGEPLSAPAAGRPAQPYVGPCPFKEEHVGIFFGRNREIEDLVSLVLAHSEVLLYSQSGAGKSSLIQAGLIPVLKSVEKCEVLSARVQGQLADIDLDRGGDFNPFVFHTLLSWEGETDIDQSRLAHLWQMSSSDGSVAEYLAHKAAPADEDGLPLPRVLIFDQFEELFTTYPQYWRQRKGFFAQVRAALKRDPNLHVLFAMREEYLASLDPYAPLLPEKLGTRYRLQRMRPAAAKAAIERPLVGTGRCFAPGVVDEVVLKDLLAVEIDTPQGPQTITEDYIEPVQLQVVCQNLWRGLGPADKEITSGQVQKSGANVNQALRNFYEDALRTVVRQTKADETTLRLWFEDKLITPTSTRSTVFAGESEVGGMPLAVVQALQDLYLVRGEQRARGSWYELTHDRLIAPIRASNKAYVDRHVLSIWFHRHQRKLLTFYLPIFLCLATFIVIELLGQYDRRERAEHERERAEHESRLRGVELNVSQGMRLLEQNEPAEALLRLTRAFEVEVDERHKANHLARLMTVFGQFPRLTNCWFYEGDDAPDDAPFTVDDGRFSQDGRFALLAMNQIKNETNDDGTRTRKSVGMVRIYDAAGPTEAHLIEYRMKADRVVKFARFSHDGKWIVTASMSSKEDMGDGEVQVWPVPGAGAPTLTDKPFPEQAFKGQGVTFANFHPKNSRRIIFGCSKGTAAVWDIDQKPVYLAHGKMRVNYAEFSPTEAKEDLIVTASGDPGEAGEVRVYWAATGKRRWAKTLRGAVKFVAFSPDGRLVVSASEDAAGAAGEVQIWDAEVGDWKGGWKHAGAVLHAVFSPDGRYILSSSEDSTAVLWDRDKQEKKHAFQHGSHVYCAAFSPDGRHAITASRDRAARVWNVATGALALPPVHHNGSVQTAVFSPDGRHALTTGNTSAQLWDLWPSDSKDASAAPGSAVFPKLLGTDGWANQTPKGPRSPYVLSAVRTPDEQVEAAIWDAANGTSCNSSTT